MGCVSSALLEDDDGRSIAVGPGAIGHHIVSLTSTTYGLLANLDLSPTPSQAQPQIPEVINSWELMAGLDPVAPPRRARPHPSKHSLDQFEPRCPPGGEETVVLYTTTLRGIRKTFEDCNAVRSAIEASGAAFKERDISMDLGFREELRELLKGVSFSVPQLFVKGRRIGGAEEVLRIQEEGGLFALLEEMPRARFGGVCDGCGGVSFLPCFRCSGSRKLVVGGVVGGKGEKGVGVEKGRVVRCGECNENGLVLCPICC